MKGQLLFLLAIFYATVVLAQTSNLRCIHVGQGEGLSTLTGNVFCQDERNFTWIGTVNGLNRYDGNRCETFYNDFKDTNSLSSSYIHSIVKDNNGDLFIATPVGVDQFNETKNTFRHVSFGLSDTVSSSVFVRDLQVVSGRLYALGYQVFEYSNDAKMFRLLFSDSLQNEFSNISNGNKIVKSLVGKNNDIWFLTAEGTLFVYFEKNNSFKIVTAQNPNITLNVDLFEDSRRTVWISSDRGIFQVNDSLTFSRFNSDITALNNIPIRAISEDLNKNIWIATKSEGLFHYHNDSRKLIQYRHNVKDRFSLKSDNITSLFINSENILWIAYANAGFSFAPIENSKPFVNKDFTIIKNDSEITYSINAISESVSTNTMYIGTDGGQLFSFDTHKDAVKLVELPKGKDYTYAPLLALTSVANRIWMGGYHTDLHSLTEKTGIYQRFYQDIPQKYDIRCILPVKNDVLWIATNGHGVLCFDTRQDEFVNNETIRRLNTLINDCVLTLIEDHDGVLWIGTYYGLYSFDTKTGEGHAYQQLGKLGDISNNYIYSLLCDKSGRIWAGTLNGLNLLNSDKTSFSYYSVADGLPNNTINGMVEDNQNRIWISTDKGLSCLDPAVMKFKNYTEKDGIMGDKFIQSAVFKSQNGMLYFGSTQGLTFFNPQQFKDNHTAPLVYLTGIDINYEKMLVGAAGSVLTDDISQTKTLKLSHDQSTITFFYTAINYLNPSKCTFSYRLEGVSDRWHFIDSQHRFTLTNLAPGTYTVSITAFNEDGVEALFPATIQVVINPAWWQTWWFKALIISLLAVSLYIGIRLRINIITSQKELLEAEVLLRTDELNKANTVLIRQKEKIEQQKDALQNDMFELSIGNDELEEMAIELKRQSHELLDSNRNLVKLNLEKDTIFSIVSHDLRNNFMGIHGMSQALLNKNTDSKEFVLLNQAVNNSVDILTNLLQWVLDQSNDSFFDARYHLFADIYEEIKLYFEDAARKKGLSVNFDFDANMQVFGDKQMLCAVLRNIISNAIKFTPSGGIISVLAHVKEERFDIKIIDTGVGMTEDEVGNLLNNDFTQPTFGTSNEKGTGIGFSICKGFVAKHGGRLKVESKIDVGTTITINLPLPHRKKGNIDTTSETEDISNRGSILLVDDNMEIIHHLSSILSNTYTTHIARNGKEALEIIKEHRIDFVLSDVMMPVMDGLSLCEAVKGNSVTKSINFVLMSGVQDENTVEKTYNVGADAFLTKPFTLNALTAVINNVRLKQAENSKLTALSQKNGNVNYSQTFEDKQLEKIKNAILANISDGEYSVEQLATDVGVSRSGLYRKVKSQLGVSTLEYINSLKLQKAAELLRTKKYRINEVSEMVGYNMPDYFSTCFQKQFGVNPTEYMKQSD